MLVSSEKDKNSKFKLNPLELTIKDKPLVCEKIAYLLDLKRINLLLDVYDSADSCEDKPIIVFIHGNSASKKIFESQIDYYSTQYRVLALDLIGHGNSTKISDIDSLSAQEIFCLSEAFYNPYTMIAGVKQLLINKGIKHAHIIGWSLGGHIAYGLAIDNPDLVSSITTIGSPPIKFSSKGLIQGFKEWFVKTLVPEWVNYPKKYTVNEAELMAMRIGLNVKDKYFVDDVINSDPQMRKYLFFNIDKYDSPEFTGTVLDGEFFVKNTNIPLCLIVGENDNGINTNYIENFTGKLINQISQIITMKNAPHAAFNTHSEEFYSIINNFINRID